MKKKIGYHNIVLLNRTMSMSFFFLSTFVFVGHRFGESKDHHKSDSIDGIVFDVTEQEHEIVELCSFDKKKHPYKSKEIRGKKDPKKWND